MLEIAVKDVNSEAIAGQLLKVQILFSVLGELVVELSCSVEYL
jgi:hypothetical protein